MPYHLATPQHGPRVREKPRLIIGPAVIGRGEWALAGVKRGRVGLYRRDERSPHPRFPLPHLLRRRRDRAGEGGCRRGRPRISFTRRPFPPRPGRSAPARFGPNHRLDRTHRPGHPMVRAQPRRPDDLRPCLDRRRPRRPLGSCHLVRAERDDRPGAVQLSVRDAPVDQIVVVLSQLA